MTGVYRPSIARGTGVRFVIRLDDDRDVPLVGQVVEWLDDDRCRVSWGYQGSRGVRVEYADELNPFTRRTVSP